jgi:hypothetical protein
VFDLGEVGRMVEIENQKKCIIAVRPQLNAVRGHFFTESILSVIPAKAGIP